MKFLSCLCFVVSYLLNLPSLFIRHPPKRGTVLSRWQGNACFLCVVAYLNGQVFLSVKTLTCRFVKTAKVSGNRNSHVCQSIYIDQTEGMTA